MERLAKESKRQRKLKESEGELLPVEEGDSKE